MYRLEIPWHGCDFACLGEPCEGGEVRRARRDGLPVAFPDYRTASLCRTLERSPVMQVRFY